MGGQSVVFVPPVSPDAERWQGPARGLEYYTRTLMVDRAEHTTNIAKALKEMGVTKILLLKGRNTDSGSETKTTAVFDGMESFEIDLKVR